MQVRMYEDEAGNTWYWHNNKLVQVDWYWGLITLFNL